MDAKHIFVIGLPASGKTTLCQHLKIRFPEFAQASDLSALLELADLNEAQRNQKANLGGPWLHWDDIALRTKIAGAVPPEFIINRDHDSRLCFTSPLIWDEALIRAYAAMAYCNDLFFEFSRGSDYAYKTHFGVSDVEIYARSFDILQRALPRNCSVAVIHLMCTPASAMERNRSRRIGGHGLSSESMTTSYASDPFDISDFATDDGVAIGTLQQNWPLISINTELHLPDRACERVTAWLQSQMKLR